MAAIMQGVNQTSHLDPKGQQSQDVTFFDDFLNYTTAGLFTTFGSGGTCAWDGTAFGANGRGHNVLLTTDGTQYHIAGIQTSNALFLPVATGAAMGCEAHIKFTSQASNNAVLAFGFSSLTTTLLNSGSATTDPTTSGSYAIIYRLSGDTQWRVSVSNGSTKTVFQTVGSDFLCADGEYTLRVDIMPFSGSSVSAQNGTNCFAGFSINGKEVRDSNNFLKQLPLAYASLAAMNVLTVTQGSTANAQTAYVDYMQGNVSRGLTIPNG